MEESVFVLSRIEWHVIYIYALDNEKRFALGFMYVKKNCSTAYNIGKYLYSNA